MKLTHAALLLSFLILNTLIFHSLGQVQGILECLDKVGNTYTAHLGYKSDANVIAKPDVLNEVQRTKNYISGRHQFMESLAFTTELNWIITSSKLRVSFSTNAHNCPSVLRISMQGTLSSLPSIKNTIATGMGISSSNIKILSTSTSAVIEFYGTGIYTTFFNWVKTFNNRFNQLYWSSRGVIPTINSNGEFFTIVSTGVEKEGVYLPAISTCKLPAQLPKVCNERGQPVFEMSTPFTYTGDLSFFANTIFNLRGSFLMSGSLNLGSNPTVRVSADTKIYGGINFTGGSFSLDKGGYFIVNNYFYHKSQSMYYQYPGSSFRLNGNWSTSDNSKVYISKRANFVVSEYLNIEDSIFYIGINSNIEVSKCLTIKNSKLILDISQVDLESLELRPIRKIISFTCLQGTFSTISVNEGADLCVTIDSDYQQDKGLFLTFKIMSKSSVCSTVSSAQTILPFFVLFIIGFLL